jgi:hypothetical protein
MYPRMTEGLHKRFSGGGGAGHNESRLSKTVMTANMKSVNQVTVSLAKTGLLPGKLFNQRPACGVKKPSLNSIPKD